MVINYILKVIDPSLSLDIVTLSPNAVSTSNRSFVAEDLITVMTSPPETQFSLRRLRFFLRRKTRPARSSDSREEDPRFREQWGVGDRPGTRKMSENLAIDDAV